MVSCDAWAVDVLTPRCCWRVLPVIDVLEQDLGIPVVHPVPARCWEIQKRLHINQPVPGFGVLLNEML